MKRALVLDFGGVMTKTIFETHRETETALGLLPGTLTWRGPFDPDSDILWQQMQDGAISERDYYAQRTLEVAALCGYQWTEMSQFIQAARGAEPNNVIRPEALEVIAIAKTHGHPLAILSNELDLFYGEAFRNKLTFIDDIEVIVDATYTKILKPDARAYLACCKELSCRPEDCVFVDDQKKNVDGAAAVGMIAVQFDVTKPAASYARALASLTQ